MMNAALPNMCVALVCATVLIATPKTAFGQTVDVASWLAGCWVDTTGDVRTDEVWMAPEGGMMVGMSRTVRGGVAVGYELVRLHEKDGRLTYSADPSGQEPTDFGATEVTAERLRFENAEHDFPQAIDYERTSPDSFSASVYGEVGSAEPAFVLRYRRRPCRDGSR